MIKSPYDALGAPREESHGRILEGEFQCHECYVVDEEAKFVPSAKLLFWNCANGHFNEIEDFEVDE